MLTLTAIVFALGLGWGVIEVWNAVASKAASKQDAAQPAASEAAKQL